MRKFLAKEKGDLIAGLLLSCVLFSNQSVSADSTPHDTIVMNEVQDVAQVMECEEVLNYDARPSLFNWSHRLYEPVQEVVVLDRSEVPDGEGICQSEKKTYMSYRKVTSVTSAQYALLYSDICYTDPVTGIRMVGDRYCIAVGTGYASRIGTKIDLQMENGSTVNCILGDVKSDMHTDETHRYQAFDGSVVEMIIDPDVFGGTQQYPTELRGRISRIDIVEEE